MRPNKKSFRIPIALHIYSSLILVALITVLMIGLSNQLIFKTYIASECDKRITNAVNSCTAFAEAWRETLSADQAASSATLRENLLNSIVASTDISNDASIVLLTAPLGTSSSQDTTVLWPSPSNYNSMYIRSVDVLNTILSENELVNDTITRSVIYKDSEVYYRFVGLDYTDPSYEADTDTPYASDADQYYLLIYIDSSSYYSFYNALHIALLRSIVFAVICSAIMSILVASPIYISARKLSRFAARVGKGDFTPVKGHIVSRELSDLGDIMNSMATRLEKSDIEQKTFFQNASHELRTPLMSIQGYAEGIKYDIFDEEKKEEAVDIIISETTRLSNLVENLLSISKMDMSRSGNYQVKKQMLEVREITESVIDKVRGGLLHAGKQLINEFDIDDVYIYANEGDIFRMLENIFSNCLRYAENTVVFRCTYDISHVTFRISDDGPGISEEVQKHLFERFAKGSDGKHGIGLALANSIAAEHGGTITAYNKDDGTTGAVFEIRIPTAKCREQLSKINNEGN